MSIKASEVHNSKAGYFENWTNSASLGFEPQKEAEVVAEIQTARSIGTTPKAIANSVNGRSIRAYPDFLWLRIKNKYNTPGMFSK